MRDSWNNNDPLPHAASLRSCALMSVKHLKMAEKNIFCMRRVFLISQPHVTGIRQSEFQSPVILGVENNTGGVENSKDDTFILVYCLCLHWPTSVCARDVSLGGLSGTGFSHSSLWHSNAHICMYPRHLLLLQEMPQSASTEVVRQAESRTAV